MVIGQLDQYFDGNAMFPGFVSGVCSLSHMQIIGKFLLRLVLIFPQIADSFKLSHSLFILLVKYSCYRPIIVRPKWTIPPIDRFGLEGITINGRDRKNMNKWIICKDFYKELCQIIDKIDRYDLKYCRYFINIWSLSFDCL